MAEYISRKAAIAYIREQSEECQKAFEELGGESGIYADAYNDLAEDFYSIPAADVAPVVRCRDCKYYRVSAMLAPNKFCFRLKHPVEDRPIGYNFAPDDFCSHGERLGEVKSDAEKD